jgi:hypothetical protein
MSAKITYNDFVKEIASGQTLTLKCANEKMEHDLVIEAFGGGKPETPNSPLPIEVSTEAEMNSLLETAEVGSIYKYMGESTDAYENGALYIVEESE